MKNASLIQVPTLILQGETDTTVLPIGAKRLYTKLNAKDKRWNFFGMLDTGFYDALSPAYPRAKFNPAKREQFACIVKDWLRNH